MLVLARNPDEGIVVGGAGRIVVIDIRGNKVRLGFDFPNEILIHRREVWEMIEKDLREQLPDLSEKDQGILIQYLVAQLEFEEAQNRFYGLHDAAMPILQKRGKTVLNFCKQTREL